jgi:hypothetical protein
LFPDLLKTRLKEILAGVAYEAGPAQADLPRLVAAADARIRDIEDRHAELVDMAAALSPPVTLTLLEPVRQRRETERIRVRREADAAERRRQLEEDINQGAEQERGQPRVTRSAYLTANRNPYRE